MSFSELKIAFEKLHTEALEAFKRLSSDKQIFSDWEGKVYKAEKELEILKQSIVGNSKDIDGNGLVHRKDCEACHICQGEVRSLRIN